MSKLLWLRRFASKPALKPPPSKWKSVVGLEIHAQIIAASKLFSASSTDFGLPVNSAVSLFDAAVPGTLPVLNIACVEAGIKTALALNCQLNAVSMFDRKHYFYADLPSGYQITQQRQPLARSGWLDLLVFGPNKKSYKKVVRLHQLQLEQDSGKSLHDDLAGRSLVDLNRAGVPLMEMVFEPDLEDGEEAAALVKELILILTRLNTCSCKMEEGALRVDANVSVHEPGTELGTRTEIKNIGSVRGVANAISYEIQRQIEMKNRGEEIHNETRAWNASTRETVLMRDKEVLQDYRFMSEPNLPPLHLNLDESKRSRSKINVSDIKSKLPELPEQTRRRLCDQYQLPMESAIILVNENWLLRTFEETLALANALSPKKVANVLINDLSSVCHKHKIEPQECQIPATHFVELLELLDSEILNHHLMLLVLDEMVKAPSKSPTQISDEMDLKQISDPVEIARICQKVLANNPKVVAQYKGGKEKVFKSFVGEVHRMSNQKANMELVIETLKQLLKS